MLLGRTEATSFFHPLPKVWCGCGEIEEAACLALQDLPQLLPLLCKMGHTEMKRISLILSQGSLGAYLTCLPRDKRCYSKSSSFQTHGSYLLALPFLSFHPVVLCVFVYVCTCVLEMEGPVTQENQITIMQLSSARLG